MFIRVFIALAPLSLVLSLNLMKECEVFRIKSDYCDFHRDSGNQIRDVKKTISEEVLRIFSKNETGHRQEGRAPKENIEPRDEDFYEAEAFGIQKMNELYSTDEQKLYSLGLFLKSDNPAQYVAAFNGQSKKAKHLAMYAYAALKGSTMLHQKYPDMNPEISLSGRSSQRTTLNQQCPRRGIPQCVPASLRYRTADGSCNNPRELWWGSAMSTMTRFLPAVYDDGVQEIRRSVTGQPLPSPREISNFIHEDRDVPLAAVTHMLMQWGQFVDHDIVATAQSRGFNGTFPQCCLGNGIGFQSPEFMHPDCLPIAVPRHDSFLGPLGVRCLEFVRSSPAPREDCQFGAREHLSQVTSYLDASMVYSSSAEHSDSLRLFRNGMLQYGKIQSRKAFLPHGDVDFLCRKGSVSTSCFKAGDGRLSEQPALVSLHIVFLRLHNGIAIKLAALNPHWSDEKLFQEARRIVGALMQLITYREFLPIVLGNNIVKIFDLEVENDGYYEGYDVTVNPNIANAFSTAAYRFGHSMVQHSFVRFNKQHVPSFTNVSIHNEFTNRENLHTVGSVDRLLLGLVNQPSQRRDEYITDELTNHLFQTPSFKFGMDLASINIQRGRDHGLPPYVEWRSICGLSSIKSWNDFEKVTSSVAARKFRTVYAALEDIDLFSAGLAEKPVRGGLVGPTFACIIAQQFSNLRKGDRFWFENPNRENSFTIEQLHQLRKVTLAQILCNTMEEIETIQPFVFLTPDTRKNSRVLCEDEVIGQLNLDPWAESIGQKKRKPITRRDPFRRSKRGAKSDESRLIKPPTVPSRNPATIFQRPRPIKTNVNQNNKVNVLRPLGSLTVVVKNHAVNSPIFVNDAIYGSEIHTQTHPIMLYNQPIQSDSATKSVLSHSAAHVNKEEQNSDYDSFVEEPQPIQPNDHIGHSLTSAFYIPRNAEDANNPNPRDYGFNSKPSNNYVPRNAFFTHFAHYLYQPNKSRK